MGVALGGLRELSANVDETVLKHWARHDGVTFAKVRSPKFLACAGLVTTDPLGADGDQLLFVIMRDQQRCAESAAEFIVRAAHGRPIRSPDFLTGEFIERDDKLLIRSIAGEDHEVVPEDGRTARTRDF